MEAANFAQFWQTVHTTCLFNQHWLTWHCKTHNSTCNTNESTLLAYRIQALGLEGIWTEVKLSLQAQLEAVTVNEVVRI